VQSWTCEDDWEFLCTEVTARGVASQLCNYVGHPPHWHSQPDTLLMHRSLISRKLQCHWHYLQRWNSCKFCGIVLWIHLLACFSILHETQTEHIKCLRNDLLYKTISTMHKTCVINIRTTLFEELVNTTEMKFFLVSYMSECQIGEHPTQPYDRGWPRKPACQCMDTWW
jgi:hypothetical protein